MNRRKLVTWNLSALLALSVSGCMMDDQGMERVDYSSQSATTSNASQAPAAQQASAKSTSAKQPAQKTTPGPKREAAPQLPTMDEVE